MERLMKFKWWLNLALAILALNITTFAVGDEEGTAEEVVVVTEDAAADDVDFDANETEYVDAADDSE